MPNYLAIGMSAEEFWHGDLRLCKAYREAYAIRLDNRYMEEWHAGIYMLEALRTAAPAYREFSKGEEHKYPDKPLFSTEKTRELIEEQEEKRRMERNKAAVSAFAARFNQKFKQNGE